MSDPTQLLIADDDTELCELLATYLGEEGFELTLVHNGEAAVEKALAGVFDLLILDVMMPKMDGFEALRSIRQKSSIPVVMLTAKGDDIDRIVGLELGADDYLPKPFNPRELLARVRAILRRGGAGPVDKSHETPESLNIGDLELRPAERRASLDAAPLDLTGAEFSALELLMRSAGNVVSKQDLTQSALGRKLGRFDRSIDVHISNLRKKLGPDSCGDERIKTIRGAGYLYALPAGEDSNV